VLGPERLPEGLLVAGEVVGHQQYGVEVRLLPPWPAVTGVVDVMYVTDERPFEAFRDYPPLGAVVEAMVVTYTPSGQLRLSTRDSDLDRSRERSDD
jgi:hypothetical protein